MNNQYFELGELANFRNGINFAKALRGTGCPLIGIPDFNNRRTPDWENLGEIDPENKAGQEDYTRLNDILFVRSNGNKELVGRSLIIDRDVQALYSGFCIRTRITSKEIDPLFFFYYTKSNHFRKMISVSGGTSIQNLNQQILSSVRIPRLNLNTQKKIAKVLSDLDAKIDLNNKINSELEQMAKLIYDYWFVQFDFPMSKEQAEALGQPELVGQPFRTSGGRMVYNEELKREIPEGWGCEPLNKSIVLFDSKRIPLSKSKREKIPGDIPYFGATGIMGYVNDFIFNDEYILMAEDGSVMDADGMPIIQFIWGKTWVNNHAHVIQAKEREQNEFYYQLLKMIPVVMIKTGSIQMKINQENLKKYKVIAPPAEIILSYSKQADSIRKSLINNIEQNQKLAELRDWLLPMLMNGQITVNSAE